MLTDSSLNTLLEKLPSCTVGVIGDLFLDRYLEIDASLTEPSIETGLDSFQVVSVRSQPGAAGTVINNLVALGVGKIRVVSVIGDDGEGYELRQALSRMPSVETNWILQDRTRRTPTYTKPMLNERGKPARELNRLDIKNRRPVAAGLVNDLEKGITEVWDQSDALVVLDQVSEENCGVISVRIREFLSKRGESHPNKFVLADSRERIGSFSNLRSKPNKAECIVAAKSATLEDAVRTLAKRAHRPIYCTCGADGILLALPSAQEIELHVIPGYPVSGPVDIVGAGDSSSAAIACAIAAGLGEPEAAAFGNLVASITIQQIGTTGTATPQQVRERWREVSGGQK
jgi:bifunctional ADP-heptose synthase (sugar kinase/adenylyltransferase)